MKKIFVVEDNEGLRESIVSYLRIEDYAVTAFERLAGVQETLQMQDPDLLILDVMLPDGDGFLFARTIRQKLRTPIIFLTARTSESDRITGFEVGGDDYVIKPFSMKELMLRVRAVLNRTSHPVAAVDRALVFSGNADDSPHLRIDEPAHTVSLGEQPIPVTNAEWRILLHLAKHPAIVFSRERILGSCLDYLADGSERTVDTHIKNLRSKLGSQDWVETVRGYGYRFVGRRIQE